MKRTDQNEHIRQPRRERAQKTLNKSLALLNDQTIAAGTLHQAPKALIDKPFPTVNVEYVRERSYAGSVNQPDLTGVLIFCSAKRVGGGWLNGAVAQEEDVSLCSTWAVQAENAPEGFYSHYNGYGNECAIACKGLWLTDDNGFDIPPKDVVFLGVAAPNLNALPSLKTKDSQLINDLAGRLVAAIDGARKYHVDTLVFGAIGCGVFAWDPEHSAQALVKALKHTQWNKKMVLAIPDDRFLSVFKSVLIQAQTPAEQPKQNKKLKK